MDLMYKPIFFKYHLRDLKPFPKEHQSFKSLKDQHIEVA